MMKLRTIVCAAILLPGAAMSAPANEPLVEHDSIATLTLGAAITRPPATETLRGVVDGIDQGRNTIEIRLSQDREEFFKVQDGLIFDAVRFGDPVEISVQTISGARTIVRLSEQ
ncbi:hypothetical protein HU230_0017590 [Bradyrhizobium quebecense]|nr:hypothetical protein [Bradyrhizobium quebecense]UGA47745.1 hypothetical protein HU230_0017590 [Bradyrhizobium quebecense]